MAECFGERWPFGLDRDALVIQRGGSHEHASVCGGRRVRGSGTQAPGAVRAGSAFCDRGFRCGYGRSTSERGLRHRCRACVRSQAS
jgi:hypothetical protein